MSTTHRNPSSSAWSVDPEAVLEILNSLRTPDLNIICDRSANEVLVSVVEYERETTTTLSDLVTEVEQTLSDSGASNVREAVCAWVGSRPVSDRCGTGKGIAVLRWSNNQTDLKWQVVVPRPSGQLGEWVPTVHTNAALIHEARNNARARSANLTLTRMLAGQVAVWTYPINPALSTSVLTQPLVLNPHPDDNMYAVCAPDRPVAIAHESLATRLTDELNEPHLMVPLAALDNIGWM
jgi:hypothetical protein